MKQIERARFFLFAGIFLLLIAGILSITAYRGSPRFIYTPEDDTIHIYTFSDSLEWKGQSSVFHEKTDRGIRFTYTLQEGYAYPYAGIGFENETELFALTEYDTLLLSIADNRTESITVCLNTTTEAEHSPSRVKLCKIIKTGSSDTTHPLLLKNFIPPQWWLNEHDLFFEDIQELRPSLHVESIVLTNHEQNTITTPYSTTITSLAVTQKSPFFLLYGIVAGAILSFALFFYYQRVPQEKPAPLPPHKNILLQNHIDQDLQRLTDYIGSEFDNPDLSVEMVSENTGISRSQIPELLRKNYAMLFRQYVNTLRIKEAQRLLRETDRQITEIALAVGYRYPSTFNRIFKDTCHCSPNEYRKKEHRHE
ncbi:helix-turn-helix transcriptional regulator [Chitinivibrio alkaliphilus]|uniref:Transcriptional regulator, AraC family n=1 Tax=Chitinivibrio alkaliphilus ACht1 TaxID=1313304 RepID=U7DB90_9BACT|nr:AraC family transcriptional regulator [Chitinivibrio alkaliphilus]ERP38823.1 transcriptional regulator, AraC family [Chitinivibrio alkaliphilus ACht1]